MADVQTSRVCQVASATELVVVVLKIGGGEKQDNQDRVPPRGDAKEGGHA